MVSDFSFDLSSTDEARPGRMRVAAPRESILKPWSSELTSITSGLTSLPVDVTSRSSGYSSSSSVDSRVTSPDRRLLSAGYRSRPSSASSVTSPNHLVKSPGHSVTSPRRSVTSPHRPRQAWAEKISVDAAPLAHTSYEGSRHLHPDRIPADRPETTTALRLWENSSASLLCLRGLSPQLLRLDLRKMGLGSVRSDLVQAMDRIHTLNLSNNNLADKSFDKECRNLSTLVELRLDDNNLSQYPKAFCVKSLRRISVARNQIQTVQNLELNKKVQILVLDGNKVEKIDVDFFRSLKKLEVLYFSQNLLKELPWTLRFAKNLRVLDLSKNELITVPGDLLRLPGLTDLNLSGNKICRLPNWSVGTVPKHNIQNVDLSENLLARFPEYLLHMTEFLDVSNNRIKFIPGDSFLALQEHDWLRVDVSGNPSVIPPPTVCQNGFKSLVRFFQDQKVNGKTYHGLKVYSIGSYMSGKSSLVQSMVDQQARLEDENERTDMLDLVNLSLNYIVEEEDSDDVSAKTVNLCWHDFSGNTFYQYPQLYFLQHPGLVVLSVNLFKYQKANFYNSIGTWLEWLFTKSQHISLIVVGTKSDRIPVAQVHLMETEIMEHINEYIDRKFQQVEEEIHAIESKPHISAALSEQLKCYRNLTKVRDNMTIHPQLMVTSAKTMHGVDNLLNLIKSHISDNQMFPKVLTQVPSLWADVESFIAEEGNKNPFPVLHWQKFKEKVVNKMGMKHAINNIASYLQDVGRIIFIPNDLTFSTYVVLRPGFIIELLRNLYKDNPEEAFEFLSDGLKKLGLTQQKIDRAKHEFLVDGIADRQVLQVTWPFVTDDLLDKTTSYLVTRFGVGYRIGARKKDGTQNLTPLADEQPADAATPRPDSSARSLASSDKTTGKPVMDDFESGKITRILLPWMVKKERSGEYEREKVKNERRLAVAVVFRFPVYVPVGLFERFTVRLHNTNTWRFVDQWRHGVLARHLTERLTLYLLRQPGPNNETLIRIEVVHMGADKSDQRSWSEDESLYERAHEMWAGIMAVVNDMERYLESFPGAFYQRHVVCPSCQGLGFIGEWGAPKELQAIPTKACTRCHEAVPTALLVSPREKRGLDLAQIRRERRLRREQAEARRHESHPDLSTSQSKTSPSNVSPSSSTRLKSKTDLVPSDNSIPDLVLSDASEPILTSSDKGDLNLDLTEMEKPIFATSDIDLSHIDLIKKDAKGPSFASNDSSASLARGSGSTSSNRAPRGKSKSKAPPSDTDVSYTEVTIKVTDNDV